MQKSRFVRVLVGSSVLVGASSASADFVDASFTEEVITPGEITYKIYLNYDNPLDKQLAVSGNAAFSALQLTASSPLIQKHLVEAVPTDVPGALALPGDSWVTIGEGLANGGETQFSPGFLEGQGDAFGALISGDGFLQADNGGYFDSNPSTGVFDAGSGILIAQFTFVEGTTWNYIGISVFNANGTDLTEVAFSVGNVDPADDCDDDGLSDSAEIAANPSLDCDNSGVLDSCEIADGTLQDCNGNGLPDVCYPQGDCNANGIDDSCEDDCDSDGFIDACDLDDDGDGILDDPCDA